METQTSQEKKLARAKKRIKEIKNFYRHLTFYLLVNTFLTILTNYYDVSITLFQDSNANYESVIAQNPVWYVWGVFLLANAIKVFVLPSIMGKGWRNKKIEKYMNDKNMH